MIRHPQIPRVGRNNFCVPVARVASDDSDAKADSGKLRWRLGQGPSSALRVVARLSGAARQRQRLILPDPERRLSSHHCIVEQQGGRYVVTDVSKNGVYLNDVERPLGNGASSVLTDGDLVAIGDYQIRVEIEGVPQRAPAPVAGFADRNPFGGETGPADDPFGARSGTGGVADRTLIA